MFECRYCGKSGKNLNSQRQHEIRCVKNPDRKDYDKLTKYVRANIKGKNKYTCESIMRQANVLKEMYNSGEFVSNQTGKPGTFLGKHHTALTKEKISKAVSKTRLAGYADGSLKPAPGVGRGKYSYIVYKGTKYLLRSTYEFIFALYLIDKGIKFEYEAIRVPAVRPNKYAKTFLSDFSVGDTIIEIKGIPSGKDYYIKESFEHAGYKFLELFEYEVTLCKEYLIDKGFNIDKLVDDIAAGHNSRQYFTYLP